MTNARPIGAIDLLALADDVRRTTLTRDALRAENDVLAYRHALEPLLAEVAYVAPEAAHDREAAARLFSLLPRLRAISKDEGAPGAVRQDAADACEHVKRVLLPESS